MMAEEYKVEELINELKSKSELTGKEYEEFVSSSKFIESLCISSSAFFLFIDLSKMQYQYVSPGFEHVLGYSHSELLKIGGDFIFSRFHPNSILTQKKIHKTTADFLNGKSSREKLKYKFSYNIKVLNAQGEYVNILRHNRLLKLDKNGNPLLMFAICVVIDPYFNENKHILTISKITSKGDVLKFKKEFHPEFENGILTKQETEVWKLISADYSGKEIAKMLDITVNTVNTHRKRIYKKLREHNP